MLKKKRERETRVLEPFFLCQSFSFRRSSNQFETFSSPSKCRNRPTCCCTTRPSSRAGAGLWARPFCRSARDRRRCTSRRRRQSVSEERFELFFFFYSIFRRSMPFSTSSTSSLLFCSLLSFLFQASANSRPCSKPSTSSSPSRKGPPPWPSSSGLDAPTSSF